MLRKSEFDTIIKNNLIKYSSSKFGYRVTATDKVYENYYSKSEFKDFKNKMKSEYPDIFNDYDSGKGSELVESKNYPPKMASVASSSRFCYFALRNGAEALGATGKVKFEYGCPITGVPGISPQLDAYIPDENIYVEAKCHEIFDSHSVDLKIKYWDKIFGTNNSFGFSPLDKPDANSFSIPISEFDLSKSSSRFDVKQLLCHLMGIACAGNPNSTLVYLFFKPKCDDNSLQNAVDEVFSELADEIISIFNSSPIKAFCIKHNIALKAVAEYAHTMEPLTAENIVIYY